MYKHKIHHQTHSKHQHDKRLALKNKNKEISTLYNQQRKTETCNK